MSDTPTDAELEALIAANLLVVEGGQCAFESWVDIRPELLKFTREVLAKWGAPQAGVGAACQHEWAGFARTSLPPKYACRKCHAFFDSPPTTTPQPTQAQARAVPLTDEQWQRIADLTGGRILTQAVKDEIERVIGIKGDQHG